MSRGVVYVASGSSYMDLAKTSAQSVKKHNPSLPITIYTDEDIDHETFDQEMKLEEPINKPGDSILSERYFPYDRNLYLDVDTYVCDSLSGVFDLLDMFDLALAHNNSRLKWNEEFYGGIDFNIPDSFTEYNSGVVAYNDCSEVKDLFSRWSREYEDLDFYLNQPSLRRALYYTDVDFATLPPEYNFMSHRVGYACGKVKILHQSSSRVPLSEFAELLNSTDEKRVITWDDYPCRVVPESHLSLRYTVKRLMASIRRKKNKDGTLSLVRAMVSRLFK